MKQESQITRGLAAAQEHHAANQSTAVLYRLYTESTGGPLDRTLIDLVSRYFQGATFLAAIGLWERQAENATVIEIVGTRDDLQNIIHLAGDIRAVNKQTSVLVTWAPVSRLDVTAL